MQNNLSYGSESGVIQEGGIDSVLKVQIDLLTALNEKLSESNVIYDKFTDISGNVCFYYNFENGHFEAVGDFESMFGMKVEKLTDTELLPEFVNEENQQDIKQIISIDEIPEETFTREFSLKANRRWIEGKAAVKRNENGDPFEKCVSFRDITTIKTQKDELLYLAYYDGLTGLYNRYCFIERLNETIERAKKENARVCLSMVDINGFKRINDSMGLVAGDELIQLFGQFLTAFNNKKTTVGRFGTDVFVFSIYDPKEPDTIEDIVFRIRERLKKPFVLSNNDQIYVSVTVGVAYYPDSASTGLAILQNAEISVYAAKDNDRDKINYFDNSLMKRFLESFNMEKKLQDAIIAKSFELYYQPQYNIESGRLRGCEALIRWKDHDGSLISPIKFIPLAEKSGGIVPIGKWVVETAVNKLKEWKQKYNFDGIMSLNISGIQLKKDAFVDNILSYLSVAKVNPENLELEITESVLLDDSKEMIEKISRLRQFGLGIALDDFGTGFSSLSYLRQLPISTLKIDKSFIDTVISDDATGIITESVVNMVRRLGLETIAEGVEKNDQMDFLRRICCDNIQGFLLGRPMPAEKFEKEVLCEQ